MSVGHGPVGRLLPDQVPELLVRMRCTADMGNFVLLVDDGVLRALGRVAGGDISDVLARQWRSHVQARAAGGAWTADGDSALNFLFGFYFVVFAATLIVVLELGIAARREVVVPALVSALPAVPGGLAVLHGVALRIPGRQMARHLNLSFVACMLPAYVMTFVLAA